MLELLIVFAIGRTFYFLAKVHGKVAWLFAVLGVVTYYGTAILGILAVALILEANQTYVSELALTFMAIPIGLVCTLILYQLLKRNWSREAEEEDDELLDQEFSDSNYRR